MTDYVNPEREVFGKFQGIERQGKIHMLNLVKLHDVATYEDGTQTTGQEAYAAYGRESGSIFSKVGGTIAWSGKLELMLIGPQEGENWDIAFIAEYPSGKAFVDMVKDPDYQKAVRHRSAAVKTSRLIRMEPREAGLNFG